MSERISRTAENPDRPFYSCRHCGVFYWKDQVPKNRLPPGPLCECGIHSIAVEDRSGRTFWKCASNIQPCTFVLLCSDPNIVLCQGCGLHVDVQYIVDESDGNVAYYDCANCGLFMQLDDDVAQAPPLPLPPQIAAQPSNLTENTPGSAQHLASDVDIAYLQKLFHVPSGVNLSKGRDASGQTWYDYLDVECAWRVRNPSKSKLYNEFREKVRECSMEEGHVDIVLKPAYEAAATTLAAHAGIELDYDINEMLLLHGTKAEYVYSILFQGLDPNLSTLGLFGRGTYFAEDGAKIDQYLGELDRQFIDKKKTQRGTRDYWIAKLHRRLYTYGVDHPNGVHYAFVCRVVMGEPVITKTGIEDPKFLELFDGDRLKSGKHSLLCELGTRIVRYREFVVHQPMAIEIQYLVALKRTRKYCALCGTQASRRTVTTTTNGNQGRIFLYCDNAGCMAKRHATTSQYIAMLPYCHCGLEAGVKKGRDGITRYYICKTHACEFRQQCPDVPNSPATPTTRKREMG